MSSWNSFSSNNVNKVQQNPRKFLRVSSNKECSFSSSSSSSIDTNYSLENEKGADINRKGSKVSAKKPKQRLEAGSLSALNSKLSFASDELIENKVRIKNWLSKITSSKDCLQMKYQINTASYERKTKYLNNSVSQTSSSIYANVIKIPTDRKLREYFKNKNSLEETVIQDEILNQPSTDESSIESSNKEVPNDNVEHEKSPKENSQKVEKKSTKPLPKMKSKYEPFLPTRSDQKKLSSKLFLGSLLPLEEKELANLRKWKLKKSKQF